MHHSTRRGTGTALAIGLATAAVACSAAAGAEEQRALVIFGTDTVTVELAETAAEREQGLMNRTEVPEGTGMLFIFQDEAPRAFWMKDTHVPLDIAYLNSELRIVSIHQMEPLDTDTYPSGGPAMFALEVRQGWFADHGIEAGDVAELVYGG